MFLRAQRIERRVYGCFACQVHGKCVVQYTGTLPIEMSDAGYVACTTCNDWQPREYVAPPNREETSHGRLGTKAATQRPLSVDECPHLGDYTDEAVEQLRCGCPGARRTAVFDCDLHELCAPLARVATLARDDVVACRFCDDNPARRPENGAAQ